jgi:hypothetical protein
MPPLSFRCGGRTPLVLARERGYAAMEQMLVGAGAR